MNLRKRTAVALLCAVALLILDSRCAAESARSALALCTETLIPGLFPLFVLSAMLVPGLAGVRIPWLARLLRFSGGCEGVFLLGCAGGFPVGAACTAQVYRSGGIGQREAERMIGLCSFCGPSFLFGVIGAKLGMGEALAIFAIQLETALLLAAFWPGGSEGHTEPAIEAVAQPEAVRRAMTSMASVCAWVILAGVAAGFLQRWVFPLLGAPLGTLLTGLLELTNGVFSLSGTDLQLRFLLCTVFVCFGGVSVLLQIGGLAAPAGLAMGQCAAQKAIHAILGAALAVLYQRLGTASLLLPPVLLFAKLAVEIPGAMVYNSQ